MVSVGVGFGAGYIGLYLFFTTVIQVSSQDTIKLRSDSLLHPNLKIIVINEDGSSSDSIQHEIWEPTNDDLQTIESLFSNEIKHGRSLDPDNELKTVSDSTTGNNNKEYLIVEKRLPVRQDQDDDTDPVIELMLVCDKDFGNLFKMDKKRILHYLTVYIRDISMRFKSLPKSDITFVINGIIILSSSDAQRFMTDQNDPPTPLSLEQILSQFASWMYSQLSHVPKFDMAILLTASQPGQTGLSYLGGACFANEKDARHYGSIVISDNGCWQSVDTTTRQIAHSLSAMRDYDKKMARKQCKDSDYIMGKGSKEMKWFFSSCTDYTINKFVGSKEASCLRQINQVPEQGGKHLDHTKLLPPSMDSQCKWLLKSDYALIEEEDTGNCKVMECWKGDNWYEFLPAQYSPCLGGGRCLNGKCRKPGVLLMNVGTGLCLNAINYNDDYGSLVLRPCAKPGTIYDRFVITDKKDGKVISTSYTNPETNEPFMTKCAFFHDGKFKVWRCVEVGATWDFVQVAEGSSEFILKLHDTPKCVHLQGDELLETENCDSSDPNMQWRVVEDDINVGFGSGRKRNFFAPALVAEDMSTLTPELAGMLYLYPKLEVVKVSSNDAEGYLVLEDWKPTNEDLAEISQLDPGEYVGKPSNKHVADTQNSHVDYIRLNNSEDSPNPTINREDQTVAVVELLVVCDKEFSDIFQQDRSKILQYVSVFFRDVKYRFDYMITSKISILVTGIVFITEKESQEFIEIGKKSDGHADYNVILPKFSSWVQKQIRRLPNFDVAILLTNVQGGSGGLTYLGGVCNIDAASQINYGTGVLYDDGRWANVLNGAHLIAHLLGAEDDEDFQDDKASCKNSSMLMRKNGQGTTPIFSACTDRSLSAFLRLPQASCLYEFRVDTSLESKLDLTFVKTPSMTDQCRKLSGNPDAAIRPSDTENCKVMECWDNDNWFKHIPLQNSPCLHGSCILERCRQSGYLLKNVGTGKCVRSRSIISGWESTVSVTCPNAKDSNSFDRFVISSSPKGTSFGTPMIKQNALKDKSLYLNHANDLWVEEFNPRDSAFYWDILDKGNGQFLLRQKSKNACVSGNLEKVNCEDNELNKWTLVDELNNVVTDLSHITNVPPYDFNTAVPDTVILHPLVQVVQVKNAETLDFVPWMPTNQEVTDMKSYKSYAEFGIKDALKKLPSNNQTNYLTLPMESNETISSNPTMLDNSNAVVELMVVCDHEFSSLFSHDNKKILEYVTIYFYDVSLRLQTLELANVSLIISGILVIDNPTAQPFIENNKGPDGQLNYENVLSSFASWSYNLYRHVPNFDLAVLLTNANFEYGGGLSYLESACNANHKDKMYYGTVVVSDDGAWRSVVNAARYIGHSIGAMEDEKSFYSFNTTCPIIANVTNDCSDNNCEIGTSTDSNDLATCSADTPCPTPAPSQTENCTDPETCAATSNTTDNTDSVINIVKEPESIEIITFPHNSTPSVECTLTRSCTKPEYIMTMSTSDEQDDSKWYFSNCSAASVRKFIRSPKASCLRTFSTGKTVPPMINHAHWLPPDMKVQCQLLFKSPLAKATKESSCKRMYCELGDDTLLHAPVENTPCLNNEGRCIRGVCRPNGKLLRNIGSNDCIQPPKVATEKQLKMDKCPNPASPLSRFSIVNATVWHGQLIQTPLSSPDLKMDDNRCLFIHEDWEKMEIEECEQEDFRFGFNIFEVDKNQYLLLVPFTASCAKAAEDGTIELVKNCDTKMNDPFVRWTFE